MTTDYIVASLPTLRFDDPAPISWEKFCEIAGGRWKEQVEDGRWKVEQRNLSNSTVQASTSNLQPAIPEWDDLETQLKNAIAEARGGARFARPVTGCSLYWKKRVLDCFAEKDVLKRDELLDRVWWDAAGELTPPSEPLGKGALATYAVRLKIALKRSLISKDKGNAAFDRLTASTKRDR